MYARNFGRDSAANPWLPGEVIELTGTRSTMVKFSDGRTVRHHMDHLRRRLAAPQPIAEFDWDTTPPPSTLTDPVVSTPPSPTSQLR